MLACMVRAFALLRAVPAGFIFEAPELKISGLPPGRWRRSAGADAFQQGGVPFLALP